MADEYEVLENRCGWCGLTLPEGFESCEEFTGEMCSEQKDYISDKLHEEELAAAHWEDYMTYGDGSLGE